MWVCVCVFSISLRASRRPRLVRFLRSRVWVSRLPIMRSRVALMKVGHLACERCLGHCQVRSPAGHGLSSSHGAAAAFRRRFLDPVMPAAEVRELQIAHPASLESVVWSKCFSAMHGHGDKVLRRGLTSLPSYGYTLATTPKLRGRG